MKKINTIQPFKGELPSAFADRVGEGYAAQEPEEEKKRKGQFFTPLPIAHYMAGLSNCEKSVVKILDPGCGSGTLSCSLAEELVRSNKNLAQIELIAYEIDEKIITLAKETYAYLKEWLEGHRIKFTYILRVSDFIFFNSDTLDNQGRANETFDIVISNPPYFKLSKSDGRAEAATSVVHGQPNIYSIFLYVAASLLKPDGQLIFIIPRSFASGYYFRLFREKFFALVRLKTIHLFNSRKKAFQRDDVLQENVIISGNRIVSKENKSNGFRSKVTISLSHGLTDIDKKRNLTLYFDEILDCNSFQKILHLPTSEMEARVIHLFKSWKGNLNAYNIQISTGPVVSFRAANFIYSHPRSGISLAPLYWLHNASKMKLTWPLNKAGKGEYIQICSDSLPLLLPNKNYILLRRFSSKDDSSRLIATPYFAESVESDLIGVENHLNYIYRPNGHLERNEILGLAALFNSSLFDMYFRTFNGNVNVSATELREMPLPPLETIKQIGNEIILKNNFSQSVVDEIIPMFFEAGKEQVLQ